MIQKRHLFASLFVLALLVFVVAGAPVAFAQDGIGDKVVVGENYVLQAGEMLDGNLAVLGGTATVQRDATVHGDLTVAGGSVTVDGIVTGNVSLLGGSLRLGETAVVYGNLANFAGSVSRAPGAIIQGSTFNGFRAPEREFNEPDEFDGQQFDGETRGWLSRFFGWQLGTIGSILLMGLLGLVLVLIAPRALSRATGAVSAQPALAFGIGFLTLVLGLLAGAILLIACGLGLLVWLALVAGGVLGWIAVSLWIGRRLLQAMKVREPSPLAEMFLGVALVTLLSRLPCIGWLFGVAFVSLGLGAVVLTRFGTQEHVGPRPQPEGTGYDVMAPSPVTEPAGLDRVQTITPAGTVDTMPGQATPPPVEPPIVSDVAPSAGETADASSMLILTAIEGIDEALAARLAQAGIRTPADLAASNPVDLAEATGLTVGEILLQDWIGKARRLQG